MNICQGESGAQSGCGVYSQSIKNSNASMIQSTVCNCFNTTKRSFLHKYVTMDETWIHHFTPESNRQSAKWTAAGENRPEQPKTRTSASKVLASIFWDMLCILFINYLEKGRTINIEYYRTLLVHLNEEISKKQPQLKKKMLFYQDNAPCWSQWSQKLHKLHFELLLHPPYSPDLAPTNYWLFADLKRKPGKEIWLQWRSNIKNWGVFSSTKKVIKLLEKHWNQCITIGDHVDE